MADETTNSEDRVENQPKVETATVKKKAAGKKRVAKKKAAAKKRVTTKKKAVAKKKTPAKKAVADKVTGTEGAAAVATVADLTPPDAPRQGAKPAEPEAAKSEPKAAAPTTVAVASAMSSKSQPVETKPASTSEQTASSDVIIQAQIKKDNPPEEPSMSTDSKSAGGFWLKVIFWLVIIILGFMYIRSLAKNPSTESAASTAEVQHEETASSSDPGSEERGYTDETTVLSLSDTDSDSEPAVMESATSQQDQASATGDPEVSRGLVSGLSVSQGKPTLQAIPSEPATADEASEAAAESKTIESATAQERVTPPPTQAYYGGSSAGSVAQTQGDQAPQTMRELHAESVSKILKEFDDLRDAAKAEMEAMRNLMQAERELQEAMVPPRPPVYQRPWRGPAYHPYGAYPPARGYSPYTRP